MNQARPFHSATFATGIGMAVSHVPRLVQHVWPELPRPGSGGRMTLTYGQVVACAITQTLIGVNGAHIPDVAPAARTVGMHYDNDARYHARYLVWRPDLDGIVTAQDEYGVLDAIDQLGCVQVVRLYECETIAEEALRPREG